MEPATAVPSRHTGAALRVVPPTDGVDLAGAEHAAGAFLAALGVSTDSDATAATPRRMAEAYADRNG